MPQILRVLNVGLSPSALLLILQHFSDTSHDDVAVGVARTFAAARNALESGVWDVVAAALSALVEAAAHGVAFPLAIIDCHMPGMDGFMLVKHLREKSNLKNTRLLMMGNAQGNDAARVRELGIPLLITKPVNQSDLLEAILRQFSSKQKLAESSH